MADGGPKRKRARLTVAHEDEEEVEEDEEVYDEEAKNADAVPQLPEGPTYVRGFV